MLRPNVIECATVKALSWTSTVRSRVLRRRPPARRGRDRLPPLPKGKVYQLWVVTRSAPLSAGLLTPDGSGHVMAVADMPPGVEPVAVAVTIEPEGGVPSPTGAKYLLGAV